MSKGFSRRELVSGAAALVLGEKLAAAEVATGKKTYPVEQADAKVVTIKIAFDAGARTIVATPDNGSARLNMDDTLVITSDQTFVLQFTPLNGGPAHPFVKWPKDQEGQESPQREGTFRGKRFEATVREFDSVPLPFYSYTIAVGRSVLDPWIIVDGRVANPWICVGGRCH